MQKYCDLELRLFPTSSYDSYSDTSVVESRDSENSQQKEEEEEQRITIFYDGKMCISSYVTNLQARSLISIASKEMEEKSSLQHHQLQLPNAKASMKRSLQSFLQKRKTRIQATSPYHQHLRR